MSSYWSSDQSSPDTVRTDTNFSSPVAVGNSDFFDTISKSPWPTGHYDPFSGRSIHDHLSVRSDLRTRLNPPHRDQQRPDLYGSTFIQPTTYQKTQDLDFSRSPPSLALPVEFNSPARVKGSTSHPRRVSVASTGSAARGANIAEHGVELLAPQDAELPKVDPRYQPRRRPYNQDEFDGPAQLLPAPLGPQEQARAQAFPVQPIHLTVDEQDEVSRQANDVLAHCAFHFVAKYQFPIPLERDKPRVRLPNDREWAEWAYLLKRLATKRRIPARVLYENQIKQFVTTLENSIAVRQHTSTSRTGQATTIVRTARDDRYVLQMVSSGIQVARILMDSLAMSQLDELYTRTEAIILERRNRAKLDNFDF